MRPTDGRTTFEGNIDRQYYILLLTPHTRILTNQIAVDQYIHEVLA